MKNVAARQCLDTMGHGPPSLMGISHCHGFGNNQVMIHLLHRQTILHILDKPSFCDFQLFRLNTAGQLGVGERCVNADSQGVKLVVCRLGSVDGPWEYDEVNKIWLLKLRR